MQFQPTDNLSQWEDHRTVFISENCSVSAIQRAINIFYADEVAGTRSLIFHRQSMVSKLQWQLYNFNQCRRAPLFTLLQLARSFTRGYEIKFLQELLNNLIYFEAFSRAGKSYLFRFVVILRYYFYSISKSRDNISLWMISLTFL